MDKSLAQSGKNRRSREEARPASSLRDRSSGSAGEASTSKPRPLRLKNGQFAKENRGTGVQVSSDDPFRICKHLSIRLIRLPDSMLNSKNGMDTLKKKKRRMRRWQNGFLRQTRPKSGDRKKIEAAEAASKNAGPKIMKEVKNDANAGVSEKEASKEEKSDLSSIPSDLVRLPTPKFESEKKSNLERLRSSSTGDQVSSSSNEQIIKSFISKLPKESTIGWSSRQSVKRKINFEEDSEDEIHDHDNQSSCSRTKKPKLFQNVVEESNEGKASESEGLEKMEVPASPAKKSPGEKVKKDEPEFIRRRLRSESVIAQATIDPLAIVERLNRPKTSLGRKMREKVEEQPNDKFSMSNEAKENEKNSGDKKEPKEMENLSQKQVNEKTANMNANEAMRYLMPKDIVMCEDEDEDDDEIIEFLPTKRSRASNLISDDESTTERFQAISPSICENDSSRQKATTEKPWTNGSSKKNSPERLEVANGRKSAQRRAKSVASLRTRAASRAHYYKESTSSDEEIVTVRMTRSKSRAAMENWSSQIIPEDSNEVPSASMLSKINDPKHNFPKVDNSRSSSVSSVQEIKNARKFDDETEQSIVGDFQGENTENTSESELATHDGNSSPEIDETAAEHSSEERLRLIAREKLQVTKTAMVVLTRLENLDNLPRFKFPEVANECSNSISSEDSVSSLDDDEYDEDEYDKDSISEVTRGSSVAGEIIYYNENDNGNDCAPEMMSQTVPVAIFFGPAPIGSDEDSSPERSDSLEDPEPKKTEKSPQKQRVDSMNQKSPRSSENGGIGAGRTKEILIDENASDSNSGADTILATTENAITDEDSSEPPSTEAVESDDNRRENNQIIATIHKCLACKSLFKTAKILDQHIKSNAHCARNLHCRFCQTLVSTQTELSKHEGICEKRTASPSKVDGSNKSKITSPSPTDSAEQGSLPKSSKASEKKTPKRDQPKKSSKQKSTGKKRMPCRNDNLECNVCSLSFETKTDLSEHLYKHSPLELQEAFKIAKAKVMAASQTLAKGLKKKAKDSNGTLSAERPIVEEMQNFTPISKTLTELQISNVPIGPRTLAPQETITKVCPCHREPDMAPAEKTDLQIEMVLLCKHCRVLFRRRECLEVHYRTSSACAIDRTRERWPRLFCANCQLSLNNWADMRHHLELHAKQNSDHSIRFVCNICRVVFVGFGTLFCNHWISHSKDPMFVASRYNFPRHSVQRIDGTEKLPAGARPHEDYIFVAEHVCSTCKKPFSMRSYLEAHQAKDNCNPDKLLPRHPQDSAILEPLWECNVCRATFASQITLNTHGKIVHEHRYFNVTRDGFESVFMCTACSATRPSVSEIDEHWKTHMWRFGGSTGPNPAVNAPATSTSKAVTAVNSKDNSKSIVMSDPLDLPEVTRPEKNAPISRTILHPDSCTNETSVPASADTTTAPDSEIAPKNPGVIQGPLRVSSQGENILITKRTVRALEDPKAKVVLLNSTDQNLIASLVIEDSQKEAQDSLVGTSSPKLYEILTNKDTAAIEFGGERTLSKSADESQVESQRIPRIVDAPTADSTRCALDEIIDRVAMNRMDSYSGEKTKGSPENVSAASKNHSSNEEPEIIEILDDPDEIVVLCQKEVEKQGNSSGPVENQPVETSQTMEKAASGVRVVETAVRNATSISQSPSSSDGSSNQKRVPKNLTDRINDHAAGIRASKVSYEETRWNFIMKSLKSKSQGENQSNSNVKQGFLRVKNLSELQEVTSLLCHFCGSVFKSREAFDVHSTSQTCVAPKGQHRQNEFSAAFRDAAGRLQSTTQQQNTSSTIVTSGVIMPPPVETMRPDQMPTIIMNTASPELWNCQMPVMGVLQTATSQMNLNTTQSSINLPVSNSSTVNNIQLENNAIFIQTPDNIGNQTQPTLQTPRILSVTSLAEPIAPAIVENRARGFHVLPPMVMVPSSNLPKQLVNSQRPTSSYINYLPSSTAPTRNVSAQKKTFICDVCRNFQCDNLEAFSLHITNQHRYWGMPSGGSVDMPNSTKNSDINNTSYSNSNNNNNDNINNSFVPLRSVLELPSPPVSESSGGAFFNSTMNSIAPGAVSLPIASPVTANNRVGGENWSGNEPGENSLLIAPVSFRPQNGYPGPTFVSNNGEGSTTTGNTIVPTANCPSDIAYRCNICKIFVHRQVTRLRRHVTWSHSITDFSPRTVDSAIDRIYYCQFCPGNGLLFENKNEYHEHLYRSHQLAREEITN